MLATPADGGFAGARRWCRRAEKRLPHELAAGTGGAFVSVERSPIDIPVRDDRLREHGPARRRGPHLPEHRRVRGRDRRVTGTEADAGIEPGAVAVHIRRPVARAHRRVRRRERVPKIDAEHREPIAIAIATTSALFTKMRSISAQERTGHLQALLVANSNGIRFRNWARRKSRAVTLAAQTDARSSGLTREWARFALRRIGSRKVGTIWRRATTGSGRAHVVANWGACGRGVLACARRRVEPPRLSHIALDVKPPCPYPSADLLRVQIPRWAIRASKNQPYCPIRRVVTNPSGAARTSGFFLHNVGELRERVRGSAPPASVLPDVVDHSSAPERLGLTNAVLFSDGGRRAV